MADDAYENDGVEQDLPLDYEAILEEYRRRQMLEHLMGPIISLLLHVVMIAAASVLLVGRPMEEYAEIEVQIEELEIKELDPKLIEELQQLEEFADDVVPTVEKPVVPQEVADVAVTEDFSDQMAQTDDSMDFSDVLDIKASDTPLKMSGIYGGRSLEGRKKLLARGGGSTATETAVLRALRWLKEHQNADGSWSRTQPDAMCGLGLLTFLAHGETPLSEEFGTTVQKAMQFAVTRMMASTSPAGAGGRAYINGIVAYALSEAYGLTKIPFLKPAMEKGLNVIVQGQQRNTGGFDYRYAKGKRWDLSVAAWQVQAMKAGYVAGADVPGLIEAIENSSRFVRRITYKDGKFGYSSPGSGSWGMQGAGTLCLQLIGEGRSPEARAAVKNISENHSVVWDNEREYTAHSNPTYDWYYNTQAMFHAGQSAWRRWNPVFTKALLDNQQSDGHWKCPGKVVKGQSRPEYDPYYTTTLCALSLMVYYRYLPTYQMPKPVVSRGADALDAVGADLGLEIE